MRCLFAISCLLIPVLVSSCASEREVTYEKVEATGLDKYLSDVGYTTDENGGVSWSDEKRSQYDSKGQFAGAKGDFSGEQYNKKGYRSKRWSGNKDFNSKQYSGNKSGSQFQHSPHFVQQQANAQGQSAAAGAKNYGTSGYAGNTGEVSRGESMSRPTDSKSASRRSGYKAPPIYSLNQVNSIGVNDTNAMMGR